MLESIARLAIDRRRWVVVFWGVAIVLGYFSGYLRGPNNQSDLSEPLNDHEIYIRSLALARDAFPTVYSTADAVLVFHREGGLSEPDFAYIRHVVRLLEQNAIAQRAENAEVQWQVRSHITQPFLRDRLVSQDNEVALVKVGYNAPYASDTSCNQVEHIEALARGHTQFTMETVDGDVRTVDVTEKIADPPEGLQIELTGTAAMGRDRNMVRATVHERTMKAAVIAVLIVLLAVYRAPLAAMIPLIAVGASAYVTVQVYKLLQSYGWPISSMQIVYLICLVFGAGTDFALFWMSRFDEELGRIGDDHRPEAAKAAYVATMPGIASSAGTTILGLSVLVISEFVPSRITGPALGIALALSLVAALSLMPALATSFGQSLFWPRRKHRDARNPHRFWAHAANFVVDRPLLVLTLAGVFLTPCFVLAATVPWRYDVTGDVGEQSTFNRGREVAESHFGAANLFSWNILVRSENLAALAEAPSTQPTTTRPALFGISLGGSRERTALDDFAQRATGELVTSGVADVWSYSQPLGRDRAGVARFADAEALSAYWNAEQHTLRFELIGTHEPFTPEAIRMFNQSVAAMRVALTQAGVESDVFAVGPTAYMANVQAVAERDNDRVHIAVILAIAVAVWLLIRDWILTALLLAVTLAAYYATLGLTHLVFVHLVGVPGIDWKLQLFSFVVLMAVGQDYNIFLVSRLLEERQKASLRNAIRTSLVATGGIISSCGLITAVSLGALMVSGQDFLQQMGFAFACGALLDTFFVRPFMLPAVLVLIGRPQASTRPVVSH